MSRWPGVPDLVWCGKEPSSEAGLHFALWLILVCFEQTVWFCRNLGTSFRDRSESLVATSWIYLAYIQVHQIGGGNVFQAVHLGKSPRSIAIEKP